MEKGGPLDEIDLRLRLTSDYYFIKINVIVLRLCSGNFTQIHTQTMWCAFVFMMGWTAKITGTSSTLSWEYA